MRLTTHPLCHQSLVWFDLYLTLSSVVAWHVTGQCLPSPFQLSTLVLEITVTLHVEKFNISHILPTVSIDNTSVDSFLYNMTAGRHFNLNFTE